MQIDDFIARVASEPERTVTRTVRPIPPEVLAKVAKRGGMLLTDVLASAGPSEQCEMRYRHILGAPATRQAVDAWQSQRPSHPIPADLRTLLERVNGIHLWANVETGRSYVGLAPIEEWELARIKMYGAAADPGLLDDRYIAISYHQDHAAFDVLDVTSGMYFLMDAAGPDTTSPIGNNVEELLDWIWRSRISPMS